MSDLRQRIEAVLREYWWRANPKDIDDLAEKLMSVLQPDTDTVPLTADDVRDAVGDHYDHAPPILSESGWASFPLWHDEHLIGAFDWKGIARTLNDDSARRSVLQPDTDTVAEAIKQADTDMPYTWQECSKFEKDNYRRMARAAINAMGEQ